MGNFVIDNTDKLKEKVQSLEAIKDMCITDKIMQKGSQSKKENFMVSPRTNSYRHSKRPKKSGTCGDRFNSSR